MPPMGLAPEELLFLCFFSNLPKLAVTSLPDANLFHL